MTDKPLTKQQLASLEGVYHRDDPYELRTDTCANSTDPWFQYRGGAGGATTRMIRALQDRGYLDRVDERSGLWRGADSLLCAGAARS